MQAIGVLEAAQAAGLRVPEDLSVIGFDDVEAATLRPAHHRRAAARGRAARWARELVLRRLGGEQVESQRSWICESSTGLDRGAPTGW